MSLLCITAASVGKVATVVYQKEEEGVLSILTAARGSSQEVMSQPAHHDLAGPSKGGIQYFVLGQLYYTHF